MRIGSYGILFVLILIVFVISMGIIALGNTEFVRGSMMQNIMQDLNQPERILVMFNANFSPLAGILCAGYFLHPVTLTIIRTSKNPEKNGRDVFIGYMLAFISYATVGALGYIGFMGVNFSEYFQRIRNIPGAG